MEWSEISAGRLYQRMSMLKRQTVCITDIRLDRRIPRDLYESTFVRSLVMAPVGTGPPVGALGAYWAHVYATPPNVVAAVEALPKVKGIGTAIKRMRSAA